MVSDSGRGVNQFWRSRPFSTVNARELAAAARTMLTEFVIHAIVIR